MGGAWKLTPSLFSYSAGGGSNGRTVGIAVGTGLGVVAFGTIIGLGAVAFVPFVVFAGTTVAFVVFMWTTVAFVELDAITVALCEEEHTSDRVSEGGGAGGGVGWL